MTIWKQVQTVEALQKQFQNTIVEYLDIRVEAIGDDCLTMSMPVDSRTHQPYGILHGGASVVLAETAGSAAAIMAAEPGRACVGLDINANHLRKVRDGRVTAVARPVHLGRTTQVWQIDISDEQGRNVCVCRLTMALVDPVS